MRTAKCSRGGNFRCCTAHFCPLVPAYATTIHKFQGFEAGKTEHDRVQTLIIDCGSQNIESLQPGLLYVATSRGKTIGSMSEANPHPIDSAIYFQGSDWGIHRVQFCGTRLTGKSDGSREPNETSQKRRKWVNYLLNKMSNTTNRYDKKRRDMMELRIEHEIRNSGYSRRDIRIRIAEMITNPNSTWKSLRQRYTAPRSFFK